MTNRYISEPVDIYQYPKIRRAQNNKVITRGDVHGNFMNILHMAVTEGIAEITEENYFKLAEIYQQASFANLNASNLDRENIQEFNRLLETIKFNTHTGIRLIGDELGDRGANDLFNLLFFLKLRKNKVPLESLVSNHSIEFILACENYKNTGHFQPPMLRDGHADSLERLNVLVKNGVITADEVLDLAEIYKPTLKALSYSLNEDNSEITLFSHAGIGLNTIKDLANQFNVPYADSFPLDLASTIDLINLAFKEHVQNNTLGSHCDADAMTNAYMNPNADLTKTPLVCAIWNRRYDDVIKRPAVHNGYKVIYIHGHDSQDPQHKHGVYNLDADNNLGKKHPSILQNNKGSYNVLISDRYANTLDKVINPRPFNLPLETIKFKADLLRKDGHTAAATAADLLYLRIRDSDSSDLPQFKQTCKKAIEQATPVLESHRGWKLVINYLLATLTGIGALVVVADIGYNLATDKHLSFFKTDTAQILCDLEETLEQVGNLKL